MRAVLNFKFTVPLFGKSKIFSQQHAKLSRLTDFITFGFKFQDEVPAADLPGRRVHDHGDRKIIQIKRAGIMKLQPHVVECVGMFNIKIDKRVFKTLPLLAGKVVK